MNQSITFRNPLRGEVKFVKNPKKVEEYTADDWNLAAIMMPESSAPIFVLVEDIDEDEDEDEVEGDGLDPVVQDGGDDDEDVEGDDDGDGGAKRTEDLTSEEAAQIMSDLGA